MTSFMMASGWYNVCVKSAQGSAVSWQHPPGCLFYTALWDESHLCSDVFSCRSGPVAFSIPLRTASSTSCPVQHCLPPRCSSFSLSYVAPLIQSFSSPLRLFFSLLFCLQQILVKDLPRSLSSCVVFYVDYKRGACWDYQRQSADNQNSHLSCLSRLLSILPIILMSVEITSLAIIKHCKLL